MSARSCWCRSTEDRRRHAHSTDRSRLGQNAPACSRSCRARAGPVVVVVNQPVAAGTSVMRSRPARMSRQKPSFSMEPGKRAATPTRQWAGVWVSLHALRVTARRPGARSIGRNPQEPAQVDASAWREDAMRCGGGTSSRTGRRSVRLCHKTPAVAIADVPLRALSVILSPRS